MIGKRVRYRGNLEDFWGDYFVLCETPTPEGPRYQLGDRHRQLVLRDVRAQSITVRSDQPQHRVLNLTLRVHLVQREIAHSVPRAERLPEFWDWIDNLRSRLRHMIDDNRPVEAEYWLIQAERAARCLDHEAFQRRINALVVGGDDVSWMA